MENSNFLARAGYDAAIIEKLPSSTVRQLRWIAMGRMFATIALSISACNAVLQSLPDGFWSTIWSLLAGAACALVLWAIQHLLVCAGGGGPIRAKAPESAVFAGVAKLLLLVVVGAVAVQPLCIGIFNGAVEANVDSQIRNTLYLHLTRQQDALISADSVLQLSRARYTERLSVLGASPDALPAQTEVGKPEGVRRRRRAFIVGAQQYQNANPLNNPIADARDMNAKLEAMGFNVTVSVDEAGDTIRSRLAKYFDSLQPGDISLIYYSGHGFQADGHNYLVPVDFDPESRPNAIRISDFLDASDRRSLQLQVIILDSCRTFTGDGISVSTGGLAELQGGSNSFIAMAAKPGEVALDGAPGSHGYFTDSILRHIDKPEDINVIFRRVSKEVADSSRAADHLQQPVVTSTLTSEYVQLVDPGVALPEEPFDAVFQRVSADGRTAETVPRQTRDLPCQAPPGMDETTQLAVVRSCLQSRIAAIDRTLAEWSAVGRLTLRAHAGDLKEALLSSGLFVEKLRTVWSSAPKRAGIVTLLLAVLVAIGEIANLVFHKASSEYFNLRNSTHANLLNAAHRKSSSVVENNLRETRHPDYRRLESIREAGSWTGPYTERAPWAEKPLLASETQQSQILDWIPDASPVGQE